MNTFELRYFTVGSRVAQVWDTYADRAEALRDAKALVSTARVERCQIYETVSWEQYEAEQADELAA